MVSWKRSAIMESLLKLLDERPLNKISVKDIVEDCGISRNTFYDVGDNKLCYDRMDELLRECVDYIASNAFDEPANVLIENCCFDESDFYALGIENMIPGREENEDDD